MERQRDATKVGVNQSTMIDCDEGGGMEGSAVSSGTKPYANPSPRLRGTKDTSGRPHLAENNSSFVAHQIDHRNGRHGSDS